MSFKCIRLKKHNYFVFLENERLRLGMMEDGAPNMKAGSFDLIEVPYPTPPELLKDIADVLNKTPSEIEFLINLQKWHD